MKELRGWLHSVLVAALLYVVGHSIHSLLIAIIVDLRMLVEKQEEEEDSLTLMTPKSWLVPASAVVTKCFR